MPFTKDSIREALASVRHPVLGKSLDDAGSILKVAFCDGYVSVTLAATALNDEGKAALKQRAGDAIRQAAEREGATLAEMHIDFANPPQATPPTAPPAAGPAQ